MDEISISFVIPALNEALLIGRCLESIKALRLPPHVPGIEIIVIDTGSQDLTPQIAESHGASVIRLPLNTSIAKARNLGTKAARGIFIAFVDADCELDPNWIIVSMEHISEHTTTAVGSIFAQPPNDAPWVERLWYRLGYKKPDAVSAKVDWLPTLNILVSKSDFEMAGGFNESLTTCEDQDLGQRLRKLGNIILNTRAPARHLRESKTLYELFRRESWRGRSSLRSLAFNENPIRDIPSIVVPLIFVAALFSMIIFSAINLFNSTYMGLTLISGMLFILIPISYVIRKQVSIHSLLEFLQIFVIVSVYLIARGLANCLFHLQRYSNIKTE